jgi:hypothetical protein
MKFSTFLSVVLTAMILSLNAHAQSAAPLLWTSYIDVASDYSRIYAESSVVSRFTPGAPITVTRLQLQAAFGSSINGHKCNPLPKIKVTDGTSNYSIAIPPSTNSVHADSGPIAVSFPENAGLVLRVLPGETGCNPGSINVTVQYSVSSEFKRHFRSGTQH